MPPHDLKEALQELVRHHGNSSVLYSLADIQASREKPGSSSSPACKRSTGNAVDYVGRMTLPPEKAEVIARAVQRFEDRRFLPSLADVREFCRIYRVALGKSTSRASSIPRLSTFLAAIDTAQVITILDDNAFSGPTRLAPIADAIRNHSARRLTAHSSEFAQPVSDTTKS